MASISAAGISPQQLRPQGNFGGGFPQSQNTPQPQQGGGANPLAPVDKAGLSREAQEMGGAQGQGQQNPGAQLTQQLSQGLSAVGQAEQTQDENQVKQATEGLKGAYEGGSQSGALEQAHK